MREYIVLEQHFGDRQYWRGQTRLLRDDDAAELLALGLVSPLAVQKRRPRLKNKDAANAPVAVGIFDGGDGGVA